MTPSSNYIFIISSDNYRLSFPADIPARMRAGVAWTMFCT